MPELPEVQTTVTGLRARVRGQRIVDVWSDYTSPHYRGKKQIKDPVFFKYFKRVVVGATIMDIDRRAKNILIHLDTAHTILVHMKMTGHFLSGPYTLHRGVWIPREDGALRDPYNRHIRLMFTLSNGEHLALADMRKFAKVTLFPTGDIGTVSDLQNIGPEPLDDAFTAKLFAERLRRRSSGKIKTVLMDQSLVAGIGNIYSDEILWVAGLHPETLVKRVTDADMKKIFDATREILTRSIGLGGDSMSDYRNIDGKRGGFHPYHNAYKQNGKPCTRKGCSGSIVRKVVGARSAHFCDTHQVKR